MCPKYPGVIVLSYSSVGQTRPLSITPIRESNNPFSFGSVPSYVSGKTT